MRQALRRHNVWLEFLRRIFRLILLLLAIVLVFSIGLVIGYAVIGEGKYWEVLNRDTWQHIIQFVK